MRTASAARTPLPLLQAVTAATGLAVLAFLLWMPSVEGVNANAASLADVYLDDPFLAYAYVGSIPFFVALYNAFVLFGDVAKDAAKRLRTIRDCGIALVPVILGAEAWLFASREFSDDPAGGIAMGVLATVVALAIAVPAGVLEKRVRAAEGITRSA